MKKLALLAILSSSIALTGCGDNYPTLAQINGDEYEKLFSQIRDKAENGLSDNFWKEWEEHLEYAEEIKQALENGNIIKNNKFPSKESRHLSELIFKFAVHCSKEDGFLSGSKVCHSPINQVIELFSK
ncbi:hypothetical protein ACWIYZ_02135 [Ursidibacter arcticus]